MDDEKYKILMVDDMSCYQKLYEMAITDVIPSEVSFATNGLEALEKIESQEKYDLMILDLNMPKLGGEETLKRIRNNPNFDNMPIIILTGETEAGIQERLLEIGADDFIEKGAPPEVFVARLKAQLRYKSSIDTLNRFAADMDIFAAGVLHDIRNLETNIISICNIVKIYLEEDPEKNSELIFEEINSLDKQATRISNYAKDIIQMVRETNNELDIKSVSLIDIIKWTSETLSPGISQNLKNIEIEIPTSLENVFADEKFLKLAIFNIMQNSIKYKKGPAPAKIIISQESSDFIITKFRDYGTGIKDQELERIFKPFTRGKELIETSSHGFGLGLSLVQKVVTSMQGKVWAEQPESSDGVVICLKLPIVKKEQKNE